MRSLLRLLSVALFVWGSYGTFGAYQFISHAMRVDGRVVAVESLPGPPKPRAKIPLHVEYEVGGATVRTETRMPMVGTFAVGDTVPLWVAESDQQHATVASISVLFSGPLTYLFVGLFGFIATVLYSSKSPPTSPISSSAPAESSST